MMPTKQPTLRPAEPEAPPDTLRIAYEIHTLAQLIYARLTAPVYPPPVAPPIFH